MRPAEQSVGLPQLAKRAEISQVCHSSLYRCPGLESDNAKFSTGIRVNHKVSAEEDRPDQMLVLLCGPLQAMRVWRRVCCSHDALAMVAALEAIVVL